MVLATDDYRELSRAGDRLHSRNRLAVFLFVQRVDGTLRGFKILASNANKLHEETDPGIVQSSFAAFRGAATLSSRVEEAVEWRLDEREARGRGEEEARGVVLHEDARALVADMHAMVTIPCSASVEMYGPHESAGGDGFDALGDSWSFDMRGGLVFRGAGCMPAGNVTVPLCMPSSELFAGCRAGRWWVRTPLRFNSIRAEGWYRDSVAFARGHCFRYVSQNSLRLVETLDGRLFRFRQSCTSMPSSRAERKGLCSGVWLPDSWHDPLCMQSEGVHDDEALTPILVIARCAKWLDILSKNPLHPGVLDMEDRMPALDMEDRMPALDMEDRMPFSGV